MFCLCTITISFQCFVNYEDCFSFDLQKYVCMIMTKSHLCIVDKVLCLYISYKDVCTCECEFVKIADVKLHFIVVCV